MFVVVSYDIPNDKRRTKIFKQMENYGKRVQYSVFEAVVDDNKLKEMTDNLKDLIDKEEDSIRVYKLCESCFDKANVYGVGKLNKNEDFYII